MRARALRRPARGQRPNPSFHRRAPFHAGVPFQRPPRAGPPPPSPPAPPGTRPCSGPRRGHDDKAEAGGGGRREVRSGVEGPTKRTDLLVNTRPPRRGPIRHVGRRALSGRAARPGGRNWAGDAGVKGSPDTPGRSHARFAPASPPVVHCTRLMLPVRCASFVRPYARGVHSGRNSMGRVAAGPTLPAATFLPRWTVDVGVLCRAASRRTPPPSQRSPPPGTAPGPARGDPTGTRASRCSWARATRSTGAACLKA